MKNQGAWLLVGAVALWWYFKNNGMGFIPTQASGEFKGNPVQPLGPVQTISGTWHL